MKRVLSVHPCKKGQRYVDVRGFRPYLLPHMCSGKKAGTRKNGAKGLCEQLGRGHHRVMVRGNAEPELIRAWDIHLHWAQMGAPPRLAPKP